jgi:hypothetical protein
LVKAEIELVAAEKAAPERPLYPLKQPFG